MACSKLSSVPSMKGDRAEEFLAGFHLRSAVRPQRQGNNPASVRPVRGRSQGLHPFAQRTAAAATDPPT